MSILHRRKKVKKRHLARLAERGELTPREQDEADAADALDETEDAELELDPIVVQPTRLQLELAAAAKRRELAELERQLNTAQ